MINLYATIKDSPYFKKLVVKDLVFVEYTCMQEETKFGLWSNTNYFAFILSGKKIWRTIHQEYIVEDGDILFVKKGANLTHQFFDDQFCAVFVFIPDEFIQAFLQKHPDYLKSEQKDLTGQDAILQVQTNTLLQSYVQSIHGYINADYKLDENLISLKLEELLLGLVSNPNSKALTDYFVSLCQNETYHLTRVMEENFAYNLKLEDYAQLCHMSLSAFKKAFNQKYDTSPAKWLKERKLELALHKIRTTDLQVAQVAFECGFSSTSHFIRIFKEKYDHSPLQMRQIAD